MEVVVNNAILVNRIETSDDISLVFVGAVQAKAEKPLHPEAENALVVDEGLLVDLDHRHSL